MSTPPTPDDQLSNWFDYLRVMRAAAKEISLDTNDALDKFSQQKVADLLQGAAQLDTFKDKVNLKTGLYLSDGDISGTATFLQALNSAAPTLNDYILSVVQFVAGAAYVAMSPSQFRALLTVNVFQNDQIRKDLLNHLLADMPNVWFPPAKQTKFSAQLIVATNKTADSVNLVST